MADQPEEIAEPQRSGMLGKLIGVGVIAGVVIVETIIAFALIPDPESIAARVRAQIELANAENVEDADLLLDPDDGPISEVKLGEFNVAIHDPSANATFNVRCVVIAIVAVRDVSEFNSLLANNQNRLSERIIVEFRSATPEDLTEPGLGLIKRRILEKSNAVLGKPLIRTIVFPEYNYYVQ